MNANLPEPHPELAVNAYRSLCGLMVLVIPARRATRRTIRPAP
jgi:hypothetical protein